MKAWTEAFDDYLHVQSARTGKLIAEMKRLIKPRTKSPVVQVLAEQGRTVKPATV